MRRLGGTAALLAIVAGAASACTDQRPEPETPAPETAVPTVDDEQTGGSRPTRRPG